MADAERLIPVSAALIGKGQMATVVRDATAEDIKLLGPRRLRSRQAYSFFVVERTMRAPIGTVTRLARTCLADGKRRVYVPESTMWVRVCSGEGCWSLGNAQCRLHDNVLCTEQGCKVRTRKDGSGKCTKHGNGPRCEVDGCTNGAVHGKLCTRHDGREVCGVDGCTKMARARGEGCTTHGGGKRCNEPGCTSIAIWGKERCTIHGGRPKCEIAGCKSHAIPPTPYCVRHKGGRRCNAAGCANTAIPKCQQCKLHAPIELAARFRSQNRAYIKERIATDINYAILTRLRGRIRDALVNGSKSARTRALIGCTIDELIVHLESRFTEGMSWEVRDRIHIDHILPCSLFTLSRPSHQRVCFNYKNLQPLWKEDNLSKSDSIPERIPADLHAMLEDLVDAED
jgi:hypothetical protein